MLNLFSVITELMCEITTPFPSHNPAFIRRQSAATAELTGFVDAVDEDALLSSFVSTTLENLQKVERASHALCFMLRGYQSSLQAVVATMPLIDSLLSSCTPDSRL